MCLVPCCVILSWQNYATLSIIGALSSNLFYMKFYIHIVQNIIIQPGQPRFSFDLMKLPYARPGAAVARHFLINSTRSTGLLDCYTAGLVSWAQADLSQWVIYELGRLYLVYDLMTWRIDSLWFFFNAPDTVNLLEMKNLINNLSNIFALSSEMFTFS